MKRLTQFGTLLLLLLGAVLWSRTQVPLQPALLELVQGSDVHRLSPGQEISLKRRPFKLVFLVRPYTAEQPYAVQLAADSTPPPPEPEAFKEAHSLAIEAGGYSNLYLSWMAGHYLFFQPGEPSSLTLVETLESGDLRAAWEIKSFQKWSMEGMTPLDWEEVPDLYVLCEHPEKGSIPFSIRWKTPAN